MAPPGGPGEFFQDDPEMAGLNQADFDLSQQTQELSEKLRSAKKEDREKIKTEITQTVTRHFDVRQQRRELQIKRMEDELKKLREAITKRNESKDQIIKKRWRNWSATRTTWLLTKKQRRGTRGKVEGDSSIRVHYILWRKRHETTLDMGTLGSFELSGCRRALRGRRGMESRQCLPSRRRQAHRPPAAGRT